MDRFFSPWKSDFCTGCIQVELQTLCHGFYNKGLQGALKHGHIHYRSARQRGVEGNVFSRVWLFIGG